MVGDGGIILEEEAGEATHGEPAGEEKEGAGDEPILAAENENQNGGSGRENPGPVDPSLLHRVDGRAGVVEGEIDGAKKFPEIEGHRVGVDEGTSPEGGERSAEGALHLPGDDGDGDD